MTECFKLFIESLPAELLEIMCQAFIQNWINEEDALKENINDQNLTGLSENKSFEKLNGKFEVKSNNRSPDVP